MFVRTCQECGHRQVPLKPPSEYKGDTWRDTACKRCGSIALDYGSEGWVRDAAGKIIREPVDLKD